MNTRYLYVSKNSAYFNNPFWKTLQISIEKEIDSLIILTQNQSQKKELIQKYAIPHEKVCIFTIEEWFLYTLPEKPDSNPLIEKIWLQSTVTESKGVIKHLQSFITESLLNKTNERPTHTIKNHLTQKALALFQRYLTNPPQKTLLLSALTPSQEHLHAIQNKLAQKTVFCVGLWNLPPVFKTLFCHTIEHAATSSLLFYLDPLDPMYHAALPLYEWISACKGTERIIPLTETSSHPIPSFFYAETQDEEILLTCKHIAKNGAHDIAVLCPNKTYLTQIKITLEALNIPVTLSSKSPLAKHPAAHWICNFLTLAMSDFDRSNVLKFISDPLTQCNASFFSLLAHGYNIQDTPAQWRNAADLFVSDNPEYSDQEALLNTLITYYEKMRNTTSSQEALEYLFDVMKIFHIEEQFASIPNHEEAYEHSMNLLKTMKEQLSIHMRNTPYSIKQFTDFVKLILNETYLPYTSKSSTGVLLLEKDQSVGIEKKHIYILGLTQTLWPTLITENIFCPSTYRSALGWPTQKNLYQKDSYLLLWILQNTPNVTLSYPKLNQGSHTLPSPLIHTLFNYLSWEYIETPYPKINEALTEKELQIAAAQNTARVPERPHFDPITITHAQPKLYSATELESYQKCPYHYYHRHILKEAELENLTEDIAATKWGTLIHDILHDYYQHPPTKENLVLIAKKRFKKMAQDTFYWKVKEDILFGTSEYPGLLDTFYNTELDHPLTLKPIAFEKPFTLTIPNTDLTLKGKIDVILESPNGGCIAVLDYKTGKTLPTSADVKEFRSLQLPIYQLVLTQQHPEKECVAGIFYQLVDAQNVTKTIVSITETGKTHIDLGRKRPYKIEDGYYQQLTEHLIQLKTHIEQGHMSPALSLSPQRSSLCKVCGYRSACYDPNRFGY